MYLAAGEVYGGLPSALRDMFPSLHTKETLLSPEELAPFKVSGTQRQPCGGFLALSSWSAAGAFRGK